MNALVIIDTDTLTPATVFAPGGVEGIISKLEADVRAIEQDISTEEGREAVKSLAYKVARSKTALDEMGKELVADIKKKSGAIDAERRIIRERLDALRDEVRGPLTAWEDAETARVNGHEGVLVWITQAWQLADRTAAAIRSRILALDNEVDRDWQEFAERAAVAYQDSREKLTVMRDAAEQAERDAAELAELRRIKAEGEERDRAKAMIEAAEVAAQQEAEAAAERKRIADEQAKAREIERVAQAQRNAEAAAARAVEDERKRVAAAAAAEEAARQKREANAKHRAKINSKITAALSEVLTGDCFEAATLIEAIASGKIPHVSITY